VICLLLQAGERPKEKPLGRGRTGDEEDLVVCGDDLVEIDQGNIGVAGGLAGVWFTRRRAVVAR
jgi:hypothetical protein